MSFKTTLMIVVIALLTVGFTISAQAGPRLYDGSIIIKGFSNITTDGTTVPFEAYSPFPVPFGRHCLIGAYVPSQTSNGTWGSWSLPAYGGQVATLHTSKSSDVIASCEGTQYSYGSPLTGKGTLSTTGSSGSSRTPASPRGFAINASEMSRLTSGASLAYHGTPWNLRKNFADLKNAIGDFGAGKGPGRLGGGLLFSGPASPPYNSGKGSLTVTPGANNFGGTMRLLGTTYSFENYYSTWLADTNIVKYTWLLDYHGATGSVSGSNVIPAYGSGTALYIAKNKHLTNITTAHATVLSWTTGTVTVTATGGPLHTVLVRKGSDNRNATGAGDIQMVSPMLTRWVFSGATKAYYTGSIAQLNLRVAPEPHEWMLLSAGISMLGLLYCAKLAKRRPPSK
jgi:hypothetical protein